MEQELAKKRGKNTDAENQVENDVKRAEDELYKIPEHLKVSDNLLSVFSICKLLAPSMLLALTYTQIHISGCVDLVVFSLRLPLKLVQGNIVKSNRESQVTHDGFIE